jgi:hypothetical protein
MLVSRANAWLCLINVALSTAAIPLAAMFSQRLGLGRRSVIATSGLVAVLPTFVFLAPVLASEHLQLVLLLVAWWLSLGMVTRTRAVAAGLVYGAAILVRPESLFYLLAVPWLIRLAVPAWRRVLGLAAVTAGTAALVVLPWCVRNELVVGHGVALSSTGGLNLYFAHRSEPGYRFVEPDQTRLAGLDEVETGRRGQRLALENIRSDPVGLARDTWHHTYELYRTPTYSPYYSTRKPVDGKYVSTVSPTIARAATQASKVGWYATVALLPIGVFELLAVRRLRNARRALAALVVANWACFALVFWGMPRYRYAVEPIFVIVAAIGLATLDEVVRTRRLPVYARRREVQRAEAASR